MNNHNKDTATEKETSRIESFSDGVFAIAITLLILEIHVPEFDPNESLLSSLAHEWESIVALLIGFFTILICWINHHYMFQLIHKSNSMLLLLNGFKLLVVTTTPFVTAILAKNIGGPWEQQAVSIYCLNFAFMGLAMTGLWRYANKNGFATAPSPKSLRATTGLYTLAGVISTTIWIVSYINVMTCLILSGIMFAIYIFPRRTIEWRLSRIK